MLSANIERDMTCIPSCKHDMTRIASFVGILVLVLLLRLISSSSLSARARLAASSVSSWSVPYPAVNLLAFEKQIVCFVPFALALRECRLAC